MALAFPGAPHIRVPQVVLLLGLGGDKGKVNKPRKKPSLLLQEILPPFQFWVQSLQKSMFFVTRRGR